MDGFENRRKFAVMERAMRGQSRKFWGGGELGEAQSRVAGQLGVTEGVGQHVRRCDHGDSVEQCSVTASTPAQHLR